MKYRAIAFLIVASTLAGVTVAQDGSGQGPPKLKSVVFVSQPSTSTTTAPAPTTLQLTLR